MNRARARWLPTLLALGCTGPAADGDLRDDGSLRGELVVTLAHGDDGRSQRRYALRLRSGEERPLAFPGAPDLAPWTPLRVWGTRVGDELHVWRYERDGDLAAHPAALIDAPKKAVRRWAFVLVDMGGGVNLSKERAEQLLFSQNAGAIRSYYQEDSYGIQDL